MNDEDPELGGERRDEDFDPHGEGEPAGDREHEDDENEDDENEDDENEHGKDERGENEEDENEEDEDEHEEDEHEHDRDDDEEVLESVTIEITGLSLYTHHGVGAAEREVGQRLVFDLRLDIGETDATVTDRIEDTVDYGEVCQLVALVAQQRSHKTLERLCSTIADRLLADYELEGVWVKAAKPEPPIPLSVAEVSVEVWREAEG
jgi:dihydroneopterin aldolase